MSRLLSLPNYQLSAGDYNSGAARDGVKVEAYDNFGRLLRLREDGGLPVLWHHEAVKLSTLTYPDGDSKQPTLYFGKPGTLLRLPKAVILLSGDTDFDPEVASPALDAIPADFVSECLANGIYIGNMRDNGVRRRNETGLGGNTSGYGYLTDGLPDNGWELSGTLQRASSSGIQSFVNANKLIEPESFVGGEVLFVGAHFDNEFDRMYLTTASQNTPLAMPANTVEYDSGIPGDPFRYSYVTYYLSLLDRDAELHSACAARFIRAKWILYTEDINTFGTAIQIQKYNDMMAVITPRLPETFVLREVPDSSTPTSALMSTYFVDDVREFFGL